MVTHPKKKKKHDETGTINSLVYTGHFGSKINNSLKVSHFELFLDFRESMVPLLPVSFMLMLQYGIAFHSLAKLM